MDIECTKEHPCEDCRAEEKRLIAYGKAWDQFFDWLVPETPAVRRGSFAESFTKRWCGRED